MIKIAFLGIGSTAIVISKIKARIELKRAIVIGNGAVNIALD